MDSKSFSAMLKFNFPSTLIILFLGYNMISSCSGTRIIQQSAKNPPSWIYESNRNFIVGFGSAKTIEEAKAKAFDIVKKKIAESVVQHIVVYQSISKREYGINNKYNSDETYRAEIMTRTKSLPEIKGLSISKSTGTYWEEIKGQKVRNINCYIKYPFSVRELEVLVKQYEERDAELTDKLHEIVNKNIYEYESLVQLEQDLETLKILANNFEDQRRQFADMKRNELQNIFQGAKIEVVKNDIRTIEYQITFGGVAFTVKNSPEITIDCGRVQLVNTVSDKTWRISLNMDLCEMAADHSILIRQKIGSRTIQKVIPLNLAQVYVKLKVTGPIQFETDYWSIWNNERVFVCVIPLQCHSPRSFIIQRVEIQFHRCWNLWIMDDQYALLPSIVLDGLDKRFGGIGAEMLRLNIQQPYWESLTYSAGSQCESKISGRIYFIQPDLNRTSYVEFENISYKTDW